MFRTLLLAGLLATALATVAAPSMAASGEVCVGGIVDCTPFGNPSTDLLGCVNASVTQPASAAVTACA